jgi:hypothetical protein
MLFLEDFKSPKHERSVYKGIPIAYEKPLREYFKSIGLRHRVFYRGQRNNPLDRRGKYTRQSSCARQFAKTFAVYKDYRYE